MKMLKLVGVVALCWSFTHLLIACCCCPVPSTDSGFAVSTSTGQAQAILLDRAEHVAQAPQRY